LGLLFLLGAFSAGYSNLNVLAYYVLLSVLMLAGSLISDLRDKTGDMKAGINTMPAVLGDNNAKSVIYAILSFVSLLAVFFMRIVPIFFLVLITGFFLVKNKYNAAHILNIFLVLFTSFWIVIF